MKVPGFKIAPARGSKVRTIEIIIIHRKYSKIFFRTTWLRCLKFGKWHALVILYLVCSNEGLRVQDGPGPGGPRFEP